MESAGFHFESSTLRIAALKKERGKTKVVSLQSLPISLPINVKQLYIRYRKSSLVSSVSAITRFLNFPMTSLRKIREGLPFQLESLSHLPAQDLTYASQIYREKESSHGLFFLSTKEALQNHLEEWKKISLEPNIVTATSQALASFAQFRCKELLSVIVIDVGEKESHCTWAERGKVKKTFLLEEGIQSFITASQADQRLGQKIDKYPNVFHLSENLYPHLSHQLNLFRSKIEQVIVSFEKMGAPLLVLFTGQTEIFSDLPKYLLKDLSSVSLHEPAVPLKQEEKAFAIAIGSSLQSFASKQNEVQFLSNSFISKKVWQRRGKNGFFLLLFSCLLSCTFFWFGWKLLSDCEAKLNDSFLKQTGSTLNQTLEMIETQSEETPYLLQIPKVFEVLHWISNHPILEVLKKEADPFKMINLRYQLLSFPQIDSTDSPYAAEVELEFRLKNSISARKFHEALLEEREWVDLRKEVRWESNGESYKTSFRLKNRSPHVD